MVGIFLYFGRKHSILTLKHYKNMKMKLLNLVIVAVSVIGLVGCDFLDEESYGSTTEIFNEENGIKALVYQSYTKINNLYGGDSHYFILRSKVLICFCVVEIILKHRFVIIKV